MYRNRLISLKLSSVTAIILSLVLGFALPVSAGHEHEDQNIGKGDSKQTRLAFPIMNVQRGKVLFVNKGCVACHAVNGVGGHDAPAMDDHTDLGMISPFDFVAKMWNHAPGMLAAQEEAFGEPITFTGAEIADIIAFVHDDKAQHTFEEKDLTAKARKFMEHGHGGKMAPKAHAEELGHDHEPGEKPHED
jgi:cytochrome c